jgi:hypothetical protein
MEKNDVEGHVARMGERGIQGFDGETWRNETTWKVQLWMGG